MWITKDRFVDGVAPFLLSIDDLESERRFRNAVNLSDKIPPLIVEERLSVGNQELEVANLRGVDRWIIDFGYTCLIECVPHTARS
jgi:hypothetical protein